MTDTRPDTAPHPIPEGWAIRPGKEFATHVGPFYEPGDGDSLVLGFRPDQRHGNKRGVVHGGMIATAFDAALGNASWKAAGGRPSATVQLGIQYIGALQLGEFAIIRAEVVKTTRSIVFVRGTMRVGERVVATAEGVWKILDWRGEPFKPA